MYKKKKINGTFLKLLLIMTVFGICFYCSAKQTEAATGISVSLGNSGAASISRKTVTSYKKWYQISRTVTHAAGSYKRKAYTNSKEALKTSLRRGKRLIEMDFTFTRDGVLVCGHDWKDVKKRLTLKQFKKKKTKGGYTPLTAQEALKIMAAYRNVYLIVDSKESNIAKVYRSLVRACSKIGKKSFLNRIVVQLYFKSDYTKIKKVYPFKNWSFTLYRLKPKTNRQYQDIASFCKKKKIKVITMRDSWVTKSRMKILRKYKIECMAHTVNSMLTYKKLRKLGVTAIFTDYL